MDAAEQKISALKRMRRSLRRWLDRQAARRPHTLTVGPGAGLRFCVGHAEAAYATGANELPVQQALAAHLRPGAVFVDVGANVGFLTIVAARLVGPAGRVYAFEPVPQNVEFLRRNVQLNGFRNVVVHERAIGRASGRESLWVAQYAGGSALETATRPREITGRIEVDVVTLDELVANGALPPPDFVKIDVEGAEQQVLHGMRAILEHRRPTILYELDGETDDAIEPHAARCRQLLAACGYDVVELPESYPMNRWRVRHYFARSQSASTKASQRPVGR